ncbi:UNVERIFIED_CONTAM: hypothetical protein HDU68_001147 [Siphonaria sp. JEL0065]|nr:hypothetical protein HDU68_001147 [Siphonaria sp. JEL0065]
MSQHDQQIQWQEIIDSINGGVTPGAQFLSDTPTPSFSFDFGYSAQPDMKYQKHLDLLPFMPQVQLESFQNGTAAVQDQPLQSHHSSPLLAQRAKPLDRRLNSHPYTRPDSQCRISSPLALTTATCQDFVAPQLQQRRSQLQQQHQPQNQAYSAFIQSPIFQQYPTHKFSSTVTTNTNTPSDRQTIADLFPSPRISSTTPPGLSTDGNESDPPVRTPEVVDQAERGRRVHREAEKQRRESLRIGFEKLKDLLPLSIIAAEKNWSQTKLLEQGLEYIAELKTEADAKMEENIRLKEAVRRVATAKKNASSE